MPSDPTNPAPPLAALATLASLLRDPEHPALPRVWTPTAPPAALPGNLSARRQRNAQEIQAYRNQVRDLSQQTGIKVVWVTQTFWGQKIDPI